MLVTHKIIKQTICWWGQTTHISEWSIFLPADGICCLLTDFILQLTPSDMRGLSHFFWRQSICWWRLLPQDTLWHRFVQNICPLSPNKHFFLTENCKNVSGTFWRHTCSFPGYLLCHPAVPFSFLQSTSASSLYLLHRVASREHCWVNNSVFGWGRYQTGVRGSPVLSPHWTAYSCIEISSWLVA